MSNQEQAMEQSAEQNTEALLDAELADAGTGSTASDELTVLLEKLAQAEAAAQEEKDRALRIAAEMENLRRRSALDVEKAHKFALEKFAGDLLPIIDSLERGLELSNPDDENIRPMREGIELIYNKFLKVLNQEGLQKIETDGKDFDTDYHEAIALVPAPSEEQKGKILDCVQTGYKLNDKVIRHAKVVVAQ